jgi:pyruvate,water dikinase
MSRTPRFVPLRDATDPTRFGGKAAQSAVALRSGLPVPDGFAIAHDMLDELLAAPDEGELAALLDALSGLVAVRSSAVGEDGVVASFAGQHATVLGVRDAASLLAALREVHASASTDAARAYRAKLGLDTEPRMGIVVQRLVRAEVAGVLFSRDPRSGEDVRVIEASWGLGEVVVQGLVTPDRYRVARGGRVLARDAGEKDLEIRWADSGGTEELPVAPERIERLCLDDSALSALDALTSRCETAFGGTQDLEFAFADGTLHLLQRRAITRAS